MTKTKLFPYSPNNQDDLWNGNAEISFQLVKEAILALEVLYTWYPLVIFSILGLILARAIP